MTTTTPMRGADADQSPVEIAAEQPWAMAEISAACGAASALGLGAGRPRKPKAVLSRSSTGGMTSAPNITPSTSATCCRHGVAPTSWPVLRSWRLLFEIVATPNTTAVTNSAKATSDLDRVAAGVREQHREDQRNADTDRMPTPEIGLFDAPIRPAM